MNAMNKAKLRNMCRCLLLFVEEPFGSWQWYEVMTTFVEITNKVLLMEIGLREENLQICAVEVH